MSTSSKQSHQPIKVFLQEESGPSLAPEFYQTVPPPHHKGKDAKEGFVSPWPSAVQHGLLKFIRGRLTEYEDVAIPPKDKRPVVHRATFTSKMEDPGAIDYTWVG